MWCCSGFHKPQMTDLNHIISNGSDLGTMNLRFIWAAFHLWLNFISRFLNTRAGTSDKAKADSSPHYQGEWERVTEQEFHKKDRDPFSTRPRRYYLCLELCSLFIKNRFLLIKSSFINLSLLFQLPILLICANISLVYDFWYWILLFYDFCELWIMDLLMGVLNYG